MRLTPLFFTFFLKSLILGTASFAAPTMTEAVDVAYTTTQKKQDAILTRDPDQLRILRDQSFGQVDKCQLKDGQKSFGDALEGAVGAHMEPRVFHFTKPITDAYQLPDPKRATPVSLVSHPMCNVTSDSLKHMLGEGFVPKPEIISVLQHFAQTANEARKKYWDEINAATKEKRKPKKELLQDAIDVHFSVLGCISYEESLAGPGDAGDEKKELDQLFAEYMVEVPDAQKYFKNSKGELVRPKGMSIYTDRPGNYVIELRALRAEAAEQKKKGTYDEAEYQKKVKALKDKYTPWTVLGNFQFMPDGFGNIRACIEEWNKRVKDDACKIKMSQAAVSQALLSPAQTFNSYCGVAKLAHANYTQINTASPNGTDLSNILSGGELKDPKDRCISLVSRGGTGKVYAHFGPLRNSVKDNLGKVMMCVDGAMKYKKVWKDKSNMMEGANSPASEETGSESAN